MRLTSLILAAVGGLVPAALAQGPAFFDATGGWGVGFEHADAPATGYMAGGVAFLDFDSDGDDDLFAPSSDGRHRLYRNDGGAFVDVSNNAGVTTPATAPNMGVIVGDYNNDGHPDIYLTNRGPNQLFTNLGDQRFVENAAALGIAGDSWSSSASWADFDRDGDLDLYVGNYVDRPGFPYNMGAANNLYLNVGSALDPEFVDVAVIAGVEDSGVLPAADPMWPHPDPISGVFPGAPTFGNCLSVATTDFDDDGDADLLIGNDFGPFVLPDRLYRNDTEPGGELLFVDASVATGFNAYGHFNMGVNGADYDHDGDWDFYLSNMGPNFLFRNDGGRFVDVAAASGVVSGEVPDAGTESGTTMLTSWASIWCDFDNDLWEDLYVVNGYIPSIMPNAARSPNYVYRNNGDGTFATLPRELSGAMDDGVARGAATADVNNDGLMDLFIVNLIAEDVSTIGDSSRLLLNRGRLGARDQHWLGMRLAGRFSNSEGIGSRIDVRMGDHTIRRQALADAVYLSSNTRMIHVGAGLFESADNIDVDWPSGIHQELVGLPTDYLYQVVEPTIVMETHSAPSFDGSQLRFEATLRNLSNVEQDADVFWMLHLGDNGPFLGYVATTVRVPSLSQVEVVLPISVPPSAISNLAAVTLDQRSYVTADGAVDSRRDVWGVQLTSPANTR